VPNCGSNEATAADTEGGASPNASAARRARPKEFDALLVGVRFRTEFKDDAVESEMIAILDEWLRTVVPD